MNTKQINWPKLFKNIALHVIFWVLVVTYFAWGFGFHTEVKKHLVNSLFFLPGHFIMVYSLVYVLVPKYLLKRKYLHFFTGIFFLVLLCLIYTFVFQRTVNINQGIFSGMVLTVGKNVLPFLHIGAIVLSIKLLQYWYDQKNQTIEAEKQKTAAELKLLRTQLHPHFLFNTLNNIYSHTLELSSKTPDIVLKLKGLLHFMIFESQSAKIPLTKEIELLQNYISLEQLRYGDRLKVSESIIGEIDKYQIAPLLLLPFFENAFKHGTSKQMDRSFIDFNLSLDGSDMQFQLVNSIDQYEEGQMSKFGGLGLQNVKRRLELLYKDKYHLEIEILDGVFVVKLQLSLEAIEEEYMENLITS